MALTAKTPQTKPPLEFKETDIELPPVGTNVKLVQMNLGVDMLGMRMSLRAAKDHYLVTTRNGVLAVSKTTQRAVEIPWGSIKAVEYDLKDVVKSLPKK
jgi:hypothetical protein